MASRHYIVLFWAICFANALSAQEVPPGGIDTIRPPTSIIEPAQNEPQEKFVEDNIESKLVYGGVDSQIYDHKLNVFHLYGDAYVDYEDKKLRADYIILDLANDYADARKMPFQPYGKKPTFFDGQKEYQYNRLKYDFKNEKGIVFDAVMSEGEFIIHGERTKFVTAENNPYSDDDTGYNANSLITTCTADHPHFGFRAKKLKVVPEKVAVMGPSNLEVGGIPTPLWIPFGFYPLTEGKSSGFIFPQDYEFNSRNKGFGLRGLGWYFPINDYVHLRLTADVYTRGSFAVYANTAYKKKYKYNGSVNFSYDRTIFEDVESAESIIQQGFSLRLSHRQEPQAHPFVDVGGSINIVGNNNISRIANDAQSVLTQTFTSNFYYRHNMPGTPFSFSVGLDHNQNTQTGRVNITLPDFKLNMNTIFPFERKNKGSNEEKWYELISLDYDMRFKSFVTTGDSILFTQEMYDNIKTGMNHEVKLAMSTRVLKYFNIVPRANYDETWVLNTIEQTIGVDTSGNDIVESRNLTGFDRFYRYSAGVSLNTQIFGTKNFQKGWLRGIRHTMKPDIGYAFAPDLRSVFVDTLMYGDNQIEAYTRFEEGPFNTPSFTDLQSQITYRLNNILEIKHFSKRDSTEKKFKIFDNLTINGSYNFAADSLKWSPVSLNHTSRFFKGITTIRTSWTFDPYIQEGTRSINKTTWSEQGKLVRLDRATLRLTNRFKMQQIRELFSGKELSSRDDDPTANRPDQERPTGNQGPPQPGRNSNNSAEKMISFMELFDNININHEILYTITSRDGITEGRMATHSLSFTGLLPLTDNWNVRIGNLGYDFAKNGLTYPDVTFTRKLHCWNMSFSWTPLRDSYSFFIGVSSSNLSFLRYNYGRNNVDGLFNNIRY